MAEQEFRNETQQDHAIRLALVEQQVAGVKDELHKINGSVDKINGSIEKLVWTVITAIALAAMQFIMRGGLGA